MTGREGHAPAWPRTARGAVPTECTLGFAITSGDVFAYNELATAWSDILAYSIANAKPVVGAGAVTLIFAKLTKRRKMTIVRLTNREKAMFLNLAFRDELRFIASVIAGGLQLPLYRGNCKTSRAGGPRSRVAACSCLPTAHLVGSRVPRDHGRAGRASLPRALSATTGRGPPARGDNRQSDAVVCQSIWTI